MEPSYFWMPYDLEPGTWTMEPAAYAPGIPTMEHASTEIFGRCYQTSIPMLDGEHQYEPSAQYDPTETTEQESSVDFHNMEIMKYHRENPLSEFEKVAGECRAEHKVKIFKMHRYPASIQALALNERYTMPKVVAIGPYHHGSDKLKQAEMMKHVAAYVCIKESGHSLESIYDAVVQVARQVHSLYDKDIMAGIGYEDFLHMMFFDSCFLVQYMVLMSDYSGTAEVEESLLSFFDTYDNEIFHDIMLLQNQIPWRVVETVMKFRHVSLETFIYSMKNCLQDYKCLKVEPFEIDRRYQAPHLLGLIRFYIVGQSKTKPKFLTKEQLFSLPDSATELEKIGVTLKANNNTELIHMGVNKKCISAELILAPVSLDEARASCLLSMAALELCTTSNYYNDILDEDSAVCSYLLLLAMLVATEEDVRKLQRRQVLQGVGLANKEVIEFLTGLRDIRLGSSYVRTMMQIQLYKHRRRLWIKISAFCYRHWKVVATIGTIVSVATILGTIFTGIQTFNKL